MNGTSFALLTLKILRNSISTFLWSDGFKLSNDWRNATVDLPSCLTDFQVGERVVGIRYLLFFVSTFSKKVNDSSNYEGFKYDVGNSDG